MPEERLEPSTPVLLLAWANSAGTIEQIKLVSRNAAIVLPCTFFAGRMCRVQASCASSGIHGLALQTVHGFWRKQNEIALVVNQGLLSPEISPAHRLKRAKGGIPVMFLGLQLAYFMIYEDTAFTDYLSYEICGFGRIAPLVACITEAPFAHETSFA